ncbi:hypothetical protein NT239_06535 [Chitinibacter sp. SCUT-21]
MISPQGAQGGVRLILRLEGLAVFIAAAYWYSQLGQSWGHFAT